MAAALFGAFGLATATPYRAALAQEGPWQTLAGDPFEVKRDLEAVGVVPALTYIGEALGVAAGAPGRHEIFAEQRWEALLDVDLATLVGWDRATAHGHFYGVSGRGVSERALGNQFTVSGIEASPARRLLDAWLEQAFWDGRFSLRAGQMAADDEFITSPTAANFINGSFGWPAIAAANLPDGGPASPRARPGARARLEASDGLAILAAAFAERSEDSSGGTSHRALLIGELQKAGVAGAAPTVKLGAWYHSGPRPLPSAAGDGAGNYGVYFIVDGTVRAAPGEASAFLRASLSPDAGNAITAYVDLGIASTGLVASRPDDVLGLAVGYGRVNTLVADAGGDRTVGGDEAVLELSYQARLAPCCALQPDLQLIRYLRDEEGARRQRTALVIGLRTTIKLW